MTSSQRGSRWFSPVSNPPPTAEVDEDPRRTVSGGVLILRDVEFADTAVYQCEASNKHGSILLNTYLYVVGTSASRRPSACWEKNHLSSPPVPLLSRAELPPQILSSDGVVYRVTEGGDVVLNCESFGSPRPHVSW